MLVKNVRLQGREGLWEIEVKNGVITQISRSVDGSVDDEIDGMCGIAVPPFVEPHIHYDTALTATDTRPNQSGTLMEAIEIWSKRKEELTVQDVKKRALETMNMQVSHGVQFVRTHVDVSGPKLTALEALLELKEEVSPYISMQIVGFPQLGIENNIHGFELLEEAIKMGVDVIGGIPHFEWTREDGVRSIKRIFSLADKYQLPVDFHCDETDDEQSRFSEVIAAEANKRGMGSLVTASHTTAMHSYNDSYVSKLFRIFRESGIHFIANPLVNMNLQGRFDHYPKRRGLTRVKEMLDENINICFGTDDIYDPFYPMGTGNLLPVLHVGLHACHLMGANQIADSLDLITYNGAKTLGIEENYGIEIGKPANFIILDAESEFDAIRKQAVVTYAVRNGKVISKTIPSQTETALKIGSKA